MDLLLYGVPAALTGLAVGGIAIYLWVRRLESQNLHSADVRAKELITVTSDVRIWQEEEDPAAMIAGDRQAVTRTLAAGLASTEHATFVALLAATRNNRA